MGVAILGSINMDVVLQVQDLPRRGETIFANQVLQLPGGKGLNQAVAAARCGVPVQLAGAVGSDPSGAALMAVLRDACVDVSGVVALAGVATGHAYICVAANGDNTIIVSSGANASYPCSVTADSMRASIFLSQLEMAPDAVEKFFQSPAARGGVKILNTAPAVMAARPVLALADMLVMNETELERFSGVALTGRDGEIAAAGQQLLQQKQTLLVTLGAAGAMVIDGNGSRMVQGRKALAIDTVGAGDCFCGALAAGLSMGLMVDAAAAFANAAASISVTRQGAANAMPHLAEIEAVLA